jgi:hypothetical protein
MGYPQNKVGSEERDVRKKLNNEPVRVRPSKRTAGKPTFLTTLDGQVFLKTISAQK